MPRAWLDLEPDVRQPGLPPWSAQSERVGAVSAECLTKVLEARIMESNWNFSSVIREDPLEVVTF